MITFNMLEVGDLFTNEKGRWVKVTKHLALCVVPVHDIFPIGFQTAFNLTREVSLVWSSNPQLMYSADLKQLWVVTYDRLLVDVATQVLNIYRKEERDARGVNIYFTESTDTLWGQIKVLQEDDKKPEGFTFAGDIDYHPYGLLPYYWLKQQVDKILGNCPIIPKLAKD